MHAALAPFDRGGDAENPYKVQADLQDTMQSLVGIVRTEREMLEAVSRLSELNERAARAAVVGHREFNAGWHTAIDLRNLLDVAQAITLSALERKESRGGHFRDDYPEKNPDYATFNVATVRQPDGSMKVFRVPLPDMPAELKQIIEAEKQ